MRSCFVSGESSDVRCRLAVPLEVFEESRIVDAVPFLIVADEFVDTANPDVRKMRLEPEDRDGALTKGVHAAELAEEIDLEFVDRIGNGIEDRDELIGGWGPRGLVRENGFCEGVEWRSRNRRGRRGFVVDAIAEFGDRDVRLRVVLLQKLHFGRVEVKRDRSKGRVELNEWDRSNFLTVKPPEDPFKPNIPTMKKLPKLLPRRPMASLPLSSHSSPCNRRLFFLRRPIIPARSSGPRRDSASMRCRPTELTMPSASPLL
jgi:hypothetical protein